MYSHSLSILVHLEDEDKRIFPGTAWCMVSLLQVILHRDFKLEILIYLFAL